MKSHAGCNINAGVGPTLDGNNGFSSTVVRVTAGHYRVTLDQALAKTEMIILTQLNEDINNAGANGVAAVNVSGSTTTIEIKTWVNTALADIDVAVGVWSLRG